MVQLLYRKTTRSETRSATRPVRAQALKWSDYFVLAITQCTSARCAFLRRVWFATVLGQSVGPCQALVDVLSNHCHVPAPCVSTVRTVHELSLAVARQSGCVRPLLHVLERRQILLATVCSDGSDVSNSLFDQKEVQ